MNVKAIALIMMALLLVAGQLHAQGFGGLGTQAEGFAVPKRGVPLEFPGDHGAHDQYRIEWWYLTANLQGADGREYGVQWTLFRSALKPGNGEGWSTPQLWMGHAALTTPDRHFVAETRARGGIGQAGVTTSPFKAWIDDWSLVGRPGGGDQLDALSVKAGNAEFSYDLALNAEGPLVAQGERGYSVKSQSGSASFYYSQPFYRVAGTVNLPEGPVQVTGQAWLDREWSSQPLESNQQGWDWISLHLDNGAKVMGFQLRSTGGEPYTSATWINPDGRPEPLANGAISMIPLNTTKVSNRTVPIEWAVKLPARKLDIRIRALNPKAWMATSFPYWEGPVSISGSHGGRGYLEMTGY